MKRTKSILFMDKVFLEECRKDPRGVEVFNLNLMRDLVGLGYAVTLVADPSWRSVVRDRVAERGVEVVECRSPLGQVMGSLQAVWSLRRRKFDVFLLANVANRLVPAMGLLRRLKVVPRCVLIAHREPSRRNLLAQAKWPSTVVAVNGQIAGHFERVGIGKVAVSYGVTDADAFHPGKDRGERDRVNFCVLGHLDSAWKGSDTAMAAFRKIPQAVRRRCRLHLASFHEPPGFPGESIVTYSWMPYADMPGFLRKMDVLLVPSRDEDVMRETFSQVMVQGMLTGLPVIASSLPVLTEKLDAGGGMIFNSVDELADAMTRLASDADLRKSCGEEARKTALERYVWRTDQFVERYLFPSD